MALAPEDAVTLLRSLKAAGERTGAVEAEGALHSLRRSSRRTLDHEVERHLGPAQLTALPQTKFPSSSFTAGSLPSGTSLPFLPPSSPSSPISSPSRLSARSAAPALPSPSGGGLSSPSSSGAVTFASFHAGISPAPTAAAAPSSPTHPIQLPLSRTGILHPQAGGSFTHGSPSATAGLPFSHGSGSPLPFLHEPPVTLPASPPGTGFNLAGSPGGGGGIIGLAAASLAASAGRMYTQPSSPVNLLSPTSSYQLPTIGGATTPPGTAGVLVAATNVMRTPSGRGGSSGGGGNVNGKYPSSSPAASPLPAAPGPPILAAISSGVPPRPQRPSGSGAGFCPSGSGSGTASPTPGTAGASPVSSSRCLHPDSSSPFGNIQASPEFRLQYPQHPQQLCSPGGGAGPTSPACGAAALVAALAPESSFTLGATLGSGGGCNRRVSTNGGAAAGGYEQSSGSAAAQRLVLAAGHELNGTMGGGGGGGGSLGGTLHSHCGQQPHQQLMHSLTSGPSATNMTFGPEIMLSATIGGGRRLSTTGLPHDAVASQKLVMAAAHELSHTLNSHHHQQQGQAPQSPQKKEQQAPQQQAPSLLLPPQQLPLPQALAQQTQAQQKQEPMLLQAPASLLPLPQPQLPRASLNGGPMLAACPTKSYSSSVTAAAAAAAAATLSNSGGSPTRVPQLPRLSEPGLSSSISSSLSMSDATAMLADLRPASAARLSLAPLPSAVVQSAAAKAAAAAATSTTGSSSSVPSAVPPLAPHVPSSPPLHHRSPRPDPLLRRPSTSGSLSTTTGHHPAVTAATVARPHILSARPSVLAPLALASAAAAGLGSGGGGGFGGGGVAVIMVPGAVAESTLHDDEEDCRRSGSATTAICGGGSDVDADAMELTVRSMPAAAVAAASAAWSSHHGHGVNAGGAMVAYREGTRDGGNGVDGGGDQLFAVQSSVRMRLETEPVRFSAAAGGSGGGGGGGGGRGGGGVELGATPRLITGTLTPRQQSQHDKGGASIVAEGGAWPHRSLSGEDVVRATSGAASVSDSGGLWAPGHDILPQIKAVARASSAGSRRQSTPGLCPPLRGPSLSGAVTATGVGSAHGVELPAPRFRAVGSDGGDASGRNPAASSYLQALAAVAGGGGGGGGSPAAVTAATAAIGGGVHGQRRRQRSLSDSGCGGIAAFLAAADGGPVGLCLEDGLGVLGGMLSRVRAAEQINPNTRYTFAGGGGRRLQDLSTTFDDVTMGAAVKVAAAAELGSQVGALLAAQAHAHAERRTVLLAAASIGEDGGTTSAGASEGLVLPALFASGLAAGRLDTSVGSMSLKAMAPSVAAAAAPAGATVAFASSGARA